VKKSFHSLHARAFCHTTEDPERVLKAMACVLGHVETETLRTEGYFGNPMEILQASVHDRDLITDFFRRLSPQDRESIANSLGTRIDEGCNLFIRLDKQAAYLGEVKMVAEGDVISVRVKVNAFPARCEVAQVIVSEFLEELRTSSDAV
jgi:RNA binding exosome subunit